MIKQVQNPLKFRIAANFATPDYVAYGDFKLWLAYGLMACWLSHDGDDPNADCHFTRPVTRADVGELRGYFLDTVETLIAALWEGKHAPGDGEIDGDYQYLVIGSAEDGEEETMITWRVRLDQDAIMLELDVFGNDGSAIWLTYEAIENREGVVAALTQARKTLARSGALGQVWPKLVELAQGWGSCCGRG